MEAGKALWRYYHEQPEAIADAALYDIRLHFQGVNDKGKMNTGSQDEHYNQLMAELRQRLKVLAQKIEPKVYEYGFLKNKELLKKTIHPSVIHIHYPTQKRGLKSQK